MNIKSIIKQTEAQIGNIKRGNGTYISQTNIKHFIHLLSTKSSNESFLITPYLLSDNGGIYELYNYEFDVTVKNESSHFVEHNTKNLLPEEVLKFVKPQIIVSKYDTDFCIKAVKQYISAMENMLFSDVKDAYPEFNKSQILYQIFI